MVSLRVGMQIVFPEREGLLTRVDWKNIKPKASWSDLAKILDRKMGGVNEDPSIHSLRKVNQEFLYHYMMWASCITGHCYLLGDTG